MNDLQQISLDLKQATSRSLLVIDEFGKGTNESGLLISPSSISSSVTKSKYSLYQMVLGWHAEFSSICCPWREHPR